MVAQCRNKLVLLLQTKWCDLERLYFLPDNDCILESGLSVNSNYLSGASELHWSHALSNEVHIGSMFIKHIVNVWWKSLSRQFMHGFIVALVSFFARENEVLIFKLKQSLHLEYTCLSRREDYHAKAFCHPQNRFLTWIIAKSRCHLAEARV